MDSRKGWTDIWSKSLLGLGEEEKRAVPVVLPAAPSGNAACTDVSFYVVCSCVCGRERKWSHITMTLERGQRGGSSMDSITEHVWHEHGKELLRVGGWRHGNGVGPESTKANMDGNSIRTGWGDSSVSNELTLQAKRPSFSPQNSHKTISIVANACNLSAEEAEVGGSLGLAGQLV